MTPETFIREHPRTLLLAFGFLLGFVFGSGVGAWFIEDVFAHSPLTVAQSNPLLVTFLNGIVGGVVGMLSVRFWYPAASRGHS